MDNENLLRGIVLFVLLAIVVGIGMIIFGNTSTQLKATTPKTDASVNVSSRAATLSQTYCLEITRITNVTGNTQWNPTTYNVSFTNLDACVIHSDLPVNKKYNITYTYGKATTASNSVDSFSTALSTIATTWFGLIIVVFILVLILGMVMSGFQQR